MQQVSLYNTRTVATMFYSLFLLSTHNNSVLVSVPVHITEVAQVAGCELAAAEAELQDDWRLQGVEQQRQAATDHLGPGEVHTAQVWHSQGWNTHTHTQPRTHTNRWLNEQQLFVQSIKM